MVEINEMINYHCPRWEELPDIDLYMDQVVSVLNKHTGAFSPDKSKPITSTMINNYVKQKVVKPPKNKKYDRVHLSYLIPVCILKQVLSISDICLGIELILKTRKVPDSYDIFCELLETGLKNAFEAKPPVVYSPDDSSELRIIKAAVACFVSLQYSHYLIQQISTKE